MRKAFAQSLLNIMQLDSRVLLLTADLGYGVLDTIFQQMPDRSINVGVAEQNMVGVATGLAEAGYIPFIYSIVTFATLRPYEFLRNGPIMHGLPVRIVGVGGGYEYGNLGPTHQGLEDIGVMQMQSGITVIAPADSMQTQTAVEKTYAIQGPIYYRLGKNDNDHIQELSGMFELGKLAILREGKDVLWVVMGAITTEVIKAANLLQEQGINSTIAVMASVKPAPTQQLKSLLKHFPFVMTVEAHYEIGGLSSIVAKIIAENALRCQLITNAVPEERPSRTGSQSYYDKIYQLDAASLANKAMKAIEVTARLPVL